VAVATVAVFVPVPYFEGPSLREIVCQSMEPEAGGGSLLVRSLHVSGLSRQVPPILEQPLHYRLISRHHYGYPFPICRNGVNYWENWWLCRLAFFSLCSARKGPENLSAMRQTTLFATRIALCISAFFAFGAIAFGKVFLARWVGLSYLDDAYPPHGNVNPLPGAGGLSTTLRMRSSRLHAISFSGC